MNDAWTPFLEWLSHFAVSGLILLPALIYWCIDKKKGFFILTATSACLVVNSVIKLTACQGTGQRVRRPDRRHARKMRTGAGHYPRMARRDQDDLRAGRVQDPEGSPSQWRQHKVRRG